MTDPSHKYCKVKGSWLDKIEFDDVLYWDIDKVKLF
jgi:hypothetical protein